MERTELLERELSTSELEGVFALLDPAEDSHRINEESFSPEESRQAELAARERSNIRAAQQGDTEALAELIEMHRPRLLGLARKFVGNRPQDAEDLTQDVLEKLCKSITSFQDQGRGLAPYLSVVMKHHYIGTRRLKRTANELLNSSEDLSTTLSVSARNTNFVEDTYTNTPGLQEVARTLLSRVIESSPSGSNYAAALLLHCEGFTTAEIAERLEIPSGTVQSRIHRAREVLSRMSEEDKADLGVPADTNFGLRPAKVPTEHAAQ